MDGGEHVLGQLPLGQEVFAQLCVMEPNVHSLGWALPRVRPYYVKSVPFVKEFNLMPSEARREHHERRVKRCSKELKHLCPGEQLKHLGTSRHALGEGAVDGGVLHFEQGIESQLHVLKW